MSKKNKPGKPVEEKVKKEVVEEVDVEALNAEAEDLIGDEDDVEGDSTSESDSEESVNTDSDSENADVPEEVVRELRFLGYDVITKEKVYG